MADCIASMHNNGWGPVDSPGRCDASEDFHVFAEDFGMLGCCCYGTSNGFPENGCYDTDSNTDYPNGYNLFVQGTCYANGMGLTDTCVETEIGGNALWEYSCVNGACAGQQVSCPYMQDSCSGGACLNI
jgi:hypothetical protein